MKKLTIILGKNIHDLNIFGELSVAYHRLWDFPEVSSNGRYRVAHPLHASAYVRKTVDEIIATDRTAIVITQSGDLVNALGAAISEGKLTGGEAHTEIRLYDDQNDSFKSLHYTEEGFISAGWPFGWFQPD